MSSLDHHRRSGSRVARLLDRSRWTWLVAAATLLGVGMWLGRPAESTERASTDRAIDSRSPIPSPSRNVATPDDPPTARVAVGASVPRVQADRPEVAPRSVATRFVDEAGAPIDGVDVSWALARDSTHERSDARGRVALPWPDGSGGPLAIEARKAGWVAARRTCEEPEAGELWLGEWTLWPAISVEGWVLDPHGVAVEGATVGCIDASALAARASRVGDHDLRALCLAAVTAITRANGAFALDVPLGADRVVAWHDRWSAGASDPIHPGVAQSVVDVVVRLGPPTASRAIAGVVLEPDGAPASGARVEIATASGSATLFADAEGRFRAGHVDGQSATVFARDRRGSFGEAIARDVALGTTDLTLTLALAPQLALRVVDPDGDPIERYLASIRGLRTATTLSRIDDAFHADGWSRFAAPREPFVIDVLALGWSPKRVGPFDAADLAGAIDCVLERNGGVDGLVTADGRPLGGARVTLHPAFDAPARRNDIPLRSQAEEESAAESAPDGAFFLPTTRATRGYVRAVAEGFAPAELGPIDVDPRSRRTLRIELTRGGSLDVLVRTLSGADVSGRVVALSRGDGWVLCERTADDGSASFERLTPGDWQAVLLDHVIDARYGVTEFVVDDARRASASCTVRESERASCDLWIEPPRAGSRLIGTARIDGGAARGASIAFLDVDPAAADPCGRATIDAFGGFELVSARPNERTIRFEAAGDGPARLLVLDRVDLRAPLTQWGLDLELGLLHAVAESASSAGWVVWRSIRGSRTMIVPLLEPGSRSFSGKVPCGTGEIVLLEPQIAFDRQPGAVLAQVDVDAQEVAEVRWP